MTFANDTVTEQALIRLNENAAHTIRHLTDALDAARNVQRAAQAASAGTRALRDDDMTKISAESLRMASSLHFADNHAGLVTGIIGKIHAHREGQS